MLISFFNSTGIQLTHAIIHNSIYM